MILSFVFSHEKEARGMTQKGQYYCFGNYLREIRLAAGCKSRGAAIEKINALSPDGHQLVSDKQYSRWESGSVLPKVTAVLAIGRAFCREKEVFEKLSECIQFSSTKKDRLWRWNAESGHVKKHYQHYTTRSGSDEA